MTQPDYTLTGFRSTFAGIEALITLDGESITIVTMTLQPFILHGHPSSLP